MTITVTMKQTRRGPDGDPLTVGEEYELDDAVAAYLIGANLATDTNNAFVPQQPIPSQEIVIAGVGTLTFTNGLLVSFVEE